MSKLKLVTPAVILAAGFLAVTSTSYARPEFTQKEKKACTFCHVDAKAKPTEFTDAGKYYKAHSNSLEGYKK